MTSSLRHIVQHIGLSRKVWTPKFSSLPNLPTLCGLNKLKNFQYSEQGSIGEIFLVLGCSLDDKLQGKVKIANCFGLLSAEVTDVSFLDTKQRTLKHIPCGLKMLCKTPHSRCKNHLNTPHNLKKKLSLKVKDCSSLVSHVISLHYLCNKLVPKYNSSFHQKLPMGGLCWMTSVVARGNTRGSIFPASVQEHTFLLWGFFATASTSQFNELIIRKGMAINIIIRNNHQK